MSTIKIKLDNIDLMDLKSNHEKRRRLQEVINNTRSNKPCENSVFKQLMDEKIKNSKE